MRRALGNLNPDLVEKYPDYVCRVTADEGESVPHYRAKFQDVETKSPGYFDHLATLNDRRRCADLPQTSCLLASSVR